MDLKTYQGNSLAEALEKVKKDLGREAVILHTRTIKKGGILGVGARTLVEITASRTVNVLHPAERSTPFTPATAAAKPPPAPRGEPTRRIPPAPRAPAPAAPSPRPAPREPVFDSATHTELARLTDSFRGEMDQLRGMVRELLGRPTPSAWSPAPDVPEELRSYYTQLIQSAVADEIARDVIDKAKARLNECKARLAARAEQKTGGSASETPKVGKEGKSLEAVLRDLVPAVLLETVERLLPPTEPIQLPANGRPKLVALVGPTGVGKTTTIAKLAAHFKLREHKRVGLITIDTYRIAAIDQLKAYAEILSIPLQVVLTPGEMAATVETMRDMDVVLIDTSGRSQNDAQRLGELRGFLEAASQAAGQGGGLETHLVLSCTSHPGQLVQVAEKFAILGVDRVVFTKLDEAVGLGVILNVSNRLNLQLSYLTTGQDVPDDMEVSHRRRIAELILNRADLRRTNAPVEHVA